MAATTSSSAVLFVQPQQHNCRRSRASRPLFFPVARRTPHRGFYVVATSAEATSSVTDGGAGKPIVELEFIDPLPGKDGELGKRKADAVSGEKLLRNVMIESKIELYGPYGKVMNCGGGGSCGTCIVEIIDGRDLLNERTNTEERYLKKKPESWRLACQTIVGNKENSGKVVVQRLPQRKKK